MAIRIRDNNRIPEALRNINKINSGRARVGYITGDDYNGNQITVKGLARVHEFGVDIPVTDKMRGYLSAQFGVHLKASTTVIRIPERSFIRAGFDTGINSTVSRVREFLPFVILGDVNVNLFFQTIGEEMKGKIQEFAVDLSSPANAPLTIEIKGSSNPLVDTGNMVRSMEVVVD